MYVINRFDWSNEACDVSQMVRYGAVELENHTSILVASYLLNDNRAFLKVCIF